MHSIPLRPLLLCASACLLVFVADLLLGEQISPWALYFLPMVAGGWLFGRRLALPVALLAAMLNLLAGTLGGHPFENFGEFIAAWCNRAIGLLLVAWLIGVARRVADLESIVMDIRRDT